MVQEAAGSVCSSSGGINPGGLRLRSNCGWGRSGLMAGGAPDWSVASAAPAFGGSFPLGLLLAGDSSLSWCFRFGRREECWGFGAALPNPFRFGSGASLPGEKGDAGRISLCFGTPMPVQLPPRYWWRSVEFSPLCLGLLLFFVPVAPGFLQVCGLLLCGLRLFVRGFRSLVGSFQLLEC